jgi:hypothetical protein
MMRLALMILFCSFGFLDTTSFADDLFVRVPTDAFVGYVIPKEYATGKLSDYFGRDATGFWTPTFAQVKVAEAAVRVAMRGTKANRSSILRYDSNESQADRSRDTQYFEEQSRPYIVKNYQDYTLQFIGLIADGKKRIYCHYVHGADNKMAANAYLPGPSDSGATVWDIEYDTDSGICVDYLDMGNA